MSKTGTFLSIAEDQEGKNPNIVTPHDRLPVEGNGVSAARGGIVGAAGFGGFGEKETAAAVSNQDIWLGPTALQPIPDSAGIQMEVVSTSANDDLGNTGVEMAEIHYLDAVGNPQSEIITLDGLNPVNTIATNIRFVQCFHTYRAGTALAAVGNVSLRSTDGATVYKFIQAGQNRCLSAMRMIPKGKRFFLETLGGSSASGSGNKRSITRIYSNSIDGEIINGGDIFFPLCTAVLQDSSIAGQFQTPIPFPELSILRCLTTTDGALTISTNWHGWYEDS